MLTDESKIEQWRVVPGFKSEYEVSDLGNVRFIDGTPIPYKMDRFGYSHVKLGDGVWELRDQVIHRLVLLAFVGPPPEGKVACHRNDIPDDNRLENLYWGTNLDNGADRTRNRSSVRIWIGRKNIVTINAKGFRRITYEYYWKEGRPTALGQYQSST